MPSQQNISNPQRCEFLRRFRTFQYWNNFVLQHHLNITVLNSCKSSDISNRAFPTYLLLAPAYFTFSSGLIRIRSGVFKQELACLVASVAFMFQWQLQEHALDKVRKQKGGHQLCELHGVQELITKIHQVFSQRLQFAKNTWLLKLTRQASVGAKYHFILCHIWPWFYFYFCVHQVHIILFMFVVVIFSTFTFETMPASKPWCHIWLWPPGFMHFYLFNATFLDASPVVHLSFTICFIQCWDAVHHLLMGQGFSQSTRAISHFYHVPHFIVAFGHQSSHFLFVLRNYTPSYHTSITHHHHNCHINLLCEPPST